MVSENKKQKIGFIEKVGGSIANVHFEQCESVDERQFYITHTNGKQGKKEHEFLIRRETEKLKLIFRPFPVDEVYPFNLRSRNYTPKEYDSVTELFEEVKQFLLDHWDYYDAAFYDVVVAWILASYLSEKWKFIAYMAAIGDSGTGKTRLLTCLAALCYRAILLADPTEAVLFRVVTDAHPTLLIDESETVTTKQRQSVQNLLNAGQKRGVTVPRNQEYRIAGQIDWKLKYFDVFGFKALAGTRMWLRTLRRRSLIAYASRAVRGIEREVDLERAREIRRKLLQYRIDYIDTPFLQSKSEIKKLSETLSGSVYELFFALFSVTPKSKWDSLLKYAYKEERLRKRERSAGELAEVFYAIVNLKPRDSDTIYIKTVTEFLNRERQMSELFKNRDVGRIASLLGFEKKHLKKGNVIIWNQQIVDRLKKQYGDEVKDEGETRFKSGSIFMDSTERKREPEKERVKQ